MNRDPTPDLYKIMDEAGLESGNFLTGKKSMVKIVTEVRMKLVNQLVAYIKEREEQHGNGSL